MIFISSSLINTLSQSHAQFKRSSVRKQTADKRSEQMAFVCCVLSIMQKRKETKKTPQRLKAQSPTDKTNSADTLHLLTISLVQASAPLSVWEMGGGGGCCHHGDRSSQPASVNRPQPGILRAAGSDSNNRNLIKSAGQNHLPGSGCRLRWRSNVCIRQKPPLASVPTLVIAH